MEAGVLDRALEEANPWWRDRGWGSDDVQLRRARAAPFTYEPDVLDSLLRGGLYLLRGPRRVGKSTEIKRKIEELISSGVPPRSIVHVSVEGWTADDLEQLIVHAGRLLTGEPGTCYWFFDEVTMVNGPWPSVLKRMRDSNLHFAEDTVVVSGSSALRLEEATKELAGRRGDESDNDRLLLQMSFTAVARCLGVQVPQIEPRPPAELDAAYIADVAKEMQPWLPTLRDAWERYLEVGGYPQAVTDYLRSGVVGSSLMKTLLQVVHGDALVRSGFAPVQTIGLLRAVTRSLSSSLAVGSVATEANVSDGVAKARLEDLRRSFLAYPVHREQGLAPKPRSQAKWYFTDPLLARLAAERGAGSAPDSTALAEQQLALALLRSLETVSPGAALHHDQLLHYRSATGAEIDFVAAAFGGTCVESKYTDGKWGRAFQTIAASPYKMGVVASRTGLEEGRTGWVVPAALFAVLIGS